MAFEPGDVVMLKSGGHSMTVVTVEEEDIDCLWVGDDGQMFRQSIPAIALTIVEGIDLDETDEAEDEEAEDKDNEEDDEHEDEDDEEDGDEEEEEDNKKRAKRR